MGVNFEYVYRRRAEFEIEKGLFCEVIFQF
jgi:hypothetical protein